MIACLYHAFPEIEDSGSKSAPRFYPFGFWDIVKFAKTTHRQLITNIYHKSEKGKPRKQDLPLLKSDITTFELALTYGVHSRNHHNYYFVISYYGITKKSGS